jgi:hypothetical protein
MQMRARAATRADAEVLHELRRRSILQLAPTSMSVARAREWANKGSVASMRRRLEEVEAWVAEEHGEILGWLPCGVILSMRCTSNRPALASESARFCSGWGKRNFGDEASRSSGWTRAGTRRGSTSDMVMSSSDRVRRMTLDRCGGVLALSRPRQRRPAASSPAMRAARSRTAG